MGTITVPNNSVQTLTKCSFVFGFIKPEAVDNTKEIFQRCRAANFTIAYCKKTLLKKSQLQKYFGKGTKDIYWRLKTGKYSLNAKDNSQDYSSEECIRQGGIILDKLVNFLSRGKVVLFILSLPVEDGNAIEVLNNIVGDTDPRLAAPRTIRHDLFLANEQLMMYIDEDSFLLNLIEICDEPENMAEAILNLVPTKDLKKYNFLSQIEV